MNTSTETHEPTTAEDLTAEVEVVEHQEEVKAKAKTPKQATLVFDGDTVKAAEVRSQRDANFITDAGGKVYANLEEATAAAEGIDLGETPFHPSNTLRIAGLKVALEGPKPERKVPTTRRTSEQVKADRLKKLVDTALTLGDSAKVADLRKVAKEAGVSGSNKMSKAALLNALSAVDVSAPEA